MDLSLCLLEVCINAIEANCKNIYVYLDDNYLDKYLYLKVSDDGIGIDCLKLKNFNYSTKGINRGNGLRKVNDFCTNNNGYLNIYYDNMTSIEMVLDKKCFNMLGSIGDTLYTVLLNDKNVNLYYKQIVNNNEFEFKSIDYDIYSNEFKDLFIKEVSKKLTKN